MDTKECTTCGEAKSLTEFYKHNQGAQGVRSKCKVCWKGHNADWYAGNVDRVAEYGKSYRKRPGVYARKLEAGLVVNLTPEQLDKRRAVANKHAAKRTASGANAHAATKRRAVKLQATPSWANDQLIAAYYMEAKRLEELTGIKFHVDHIIPLQGALVSGLHVETNLQLLTAHDNQSKNNAFDPQTFCA